MALTLFTNSPSWRVVPPLDHAPGTTIQAHPCVLGSMLCTLHLREIPAQVGGLGYFRSYTLHPVEAATTTRVEPTTPPETCSRGMAYVSFTEPRTCRCPSEQGHIELMYVEVAPHLRRCGVATALLQFALQHVAAQWPSNTECVGVFLDDFTNPPSGVYTRVGFAPRTQGTASRRYAFPPVFSSPTPTKVVSSHLPTLPTPCRHAAMSTAVQESKLQRMHEVTTMRLSTRAGYGHGLFTTCDLPGGTQLRPGYLADLNKNDPIKVNLLQRYGTGYMAYQNDSMSVDSMMNDELLTYPPTFSCHDILEALACYVKQVESRRYENLFTGSMLQWVPASQAWLVTNDIPAGTELFKMYACTWFVEFLRDIHAQASTWSALATIPSAQHAADNVMVAAGEMRKSCPHFFSSDEHGMHLQHVYNKLFGRPPPPPRLSQDRRDDSVQMETNQTVRNPNHNSLIEKRLPALIKEYRNKPFLQRMWFYLRLLVRGAILTSVWIPILLFGTILPRNMWMCMVIRVLERCGIVFIKLSQWIFTRPGLCTREIRVQIMELQSESMMQVKRGYVTSADGKRTEVAITVLHPGIHSRITLDLTLLYFMAVSMTHIPCNKPQWLLISETLIQCAELMSSGLNLKPETRYREN